MYARVEDIGNYIADESQVSLSEKVETNKPGRRERALCYGIRSIGLNLGFIYTYPGEALHKHTHIHTHKERRDRNREIKRDKHRYMCIPGIVNIHIF